MKRYFLIFYQANNSTSTITGNYVLQTEDGFPHKANIDAYIKEYNSEQKIIGAVVTNIIELNEEDCKNWIK